MWNVFCFKKIIEIAKGVTGTLWEKLKVYTELTDRIGVRMYTTATMYMAPSTMTRTVSIVIQHSRAAA